MSITDALIIFILAALLIDWAFGGDNHQDQ